jgi:hypothetical protein
MSEQVYYIALVLAHVLARSKDLAIISAEFEQLIHTGGVCFYTFLVKYNGIPSNSVLEKVQAR